MFHLEICRLLAPCAVRGMFILLDWEGFGAEQQHLTARQGCRDWGHPCCQLAWGQCPSAHGDHQPAALCSKEWPWQLPFTRSDVVTQPIYLLYSKLSSLIPFIQMQSTRNSPFPSVDEIKIEQLQEFLLWSNSIVCDVFSTYLRTRGRLCL